MSVLEDIKADALRRRNEARDRDRIVHLLGYIEDNLSAHAVPHWFEWTSDDQVIITLDLKPVAQLEKPAIPLELPAPEMPDVPKAKVKAPKSNARPLAWKSDEVQNLIALVLSGKGPSEIAVQMGKPLKAVQSKIYRLRKAGKLTEPVTSPAQAQKMPPAVAAEETRLSTAAVEGRAPTSAPAVAAARKTRSTRPPPEKKKTGVVEMPQSPSEKALNAHLDALGYAGDWSAGLDRDLVEHLAGGTSVNNAAILLEVTPKDAVTRFNALCTKKGDVDHLRLLREVLAARAEVV